MVAIHLKPTKKRKEMIILLLLFISPTTRGVKRSLRCLDSRRDEWRDDGKDEFDFDEEQYEGANIIIRRG